MTRTEIATKITIFLSEDDRRDHRGVHQAIVDRARGNGLAGATVWKGIEGFGMSRHVRTARFPDSASGLPLAVELVDAPEQIEAFLPEVSELAPGSFITREQVTITRFGDSGLRPFDAAHG